MDFIIQGAGAVGCVVGTLLEADGHRVRYLTRGSQPLSEPFVVERVRGQTVRSSLPSCLGASERIQAADWVLVCVRGEQLDAAFAEIVARAGTNCSIAVAAISLDNVVERARRAGLSGTVLAYHVSFGSFRHPEHAQRFTWFPFDMPSTVTPEGDRAALPQARMLAKLLDHTGLATRSANSIRPLMAALVGLNSVLALGWSLCGWDLSRLARDGQLRIQTCQALRETLHVCGAHEPSLRLVAKLLPLAVYSLAVRALARFMGPSGRDVWRYHGPKISPQTDYVVRDLLERAQRAAVSLTVLPVLFARWQVSRGDSARVAPALDQGRALPTS